MSWIITHDELMKLSNEDFLKLTKGKSLEIYMNDGRLNQLGPNDLRGFDSTASFCVTQTKIKILIQNIDRIEIY